MSLKYFAQKLGPTHYVLPRTGSMRVDAHAFFSETLFDRTDESMWKQLASAASYPGVIGAYLMPDAHSGYGVPVGCVGCFGCSKQRGSRALRTGCIRWRT
jgi:tRNA-splicing ligase RtcB